jgi:hypothetical protein
MGERLENRRPAAETRCPKEGRKEIVVRRNIKKANNPPPLKTETTPVLFPTWSIPLKISMMIWLKK